MTNNKSNSVSDAVLNDAVSNGSQQVAGLIAQWIRPEVQQLSAYHVPDSDNMVKLDAMENPYSWPDSINKPWPEQLNTAQINRYPDPAAVKLKGALRQAFAIPEQCEILLGNGSDELIQMLAMAVAMPDRVVMSPEPSFVMFQMIASMVGMQYVGVPLTSDFSIDLPVTLDAIKKHKPALIFLAYPNNPTGNLFAEDDIRAIIEETHGLVIVDEAYYAFANASLMKWLQEYNNLLVMRTISKMGLAGLRLGYLIGNSQWLQQIDKMRLPYNISVLTQLTVQIALEHIEAFDQQTNRICQDREVLFDELKKLDGVEVFESHANFILFRVPGLSSQDVFDQLKTSGVLIKNLGNNHGPLQACLRVTVGTSEENQKFMLALKPIIASRG